MSAGGNLFTLKSHVRLIHCCRLQIKHVGKTEQIKCSWSGMQKTRMKGPRKQGGIDFSSQEDTQDVSQLTFA